MAAFWTEDPTIGNALAGLAQSFDVNRIEDMRKKRLQREAANEAIRANEDYWMAQKPPAVVPVTTGQQAWATSGGPIGTEVVPAMGPQPLRAFTPDIAAADTAATATAQDQRNAEFERVRAKQLADAALGYRHVTSMGDIATHAPMMEAQARLDMMGVPRNIEDQIKMQTQLTGKLPMMDVTGTVNNFGVVDPQGQVVSRVASRDGRTDMATGQPIAVPQGHSLVKMGEAPFDQSPYKDKGAETAALEQLNRQATIGNKPFNVTDLQRAAILLNSQFPQAQKVERDNAGNLRVIGYNEKAIPPVYTPLVAKINAGLFGVAPTAPSATPPAAPLPPAPTAGAQPGGGPVVTGAAPPAAPAAAADATKPIVPAGAISPTGVTVSEPVVQGAGDEQLKEILNHPTVKGAMDAGRAYNELKAASQAKTPEADLHMIYMLAKIYDPNSVVREGEVATAANTSPAMEKWWGLYNKQVEAGTALSDRARASFLDEGYKAASEHYKTAAGLIQYAQERATRLGLDPKNVAPPLEAPTRAAQQAPARAATQPRTTEVSPADREAIAWARANPKDPRATDILRRNGLQ